MLRCEIHPHEEEGAGKVRTRESFIKQGLPSRQNLAQREKASNSAISFKNKEGGKTTFVLVKKKEGEKSSGGRPAGRRAAFQATPVPRMQGGNSLGEESSFPETE